MTSVVACPRNRKCHLRLVLIIITLGCVLVYVQYPEFFPQSTVTPATTTNNVQEVHSSPSPSQGQEIPTVQTDEIIYNYSTYNQTCKMPELLPGGQKVYELDYLQFVAYGRRTIPKCVNIFESSRTNSFRNSTMFAINYNSELLKLNPGSYFWENTTCFYEILGENYKHMFISFNSTQSGNEIEITSNITKLSPIVESILVWCKKTSSKSSNSNSKSKEIKIIYQDYLSQVPLKPKVEIALKDLPATKNSSDYPSVLILGMDSVSRMNFQRYMPKVHDFLVHVMKAVDFKGFNSIGNLTPFSQWPLFSGLSYPELNKACGRDSYGSDSDPQNNCNFIWRDFRKKGYRTSFSEDGTYEGVELDGHLRKECFDFDYDFRTVSRLLEHVDKQTKFTGCYGPRLTIDILLENFMKTAQASSKLNKPIWHLTWSYELTHDVNYFTKFAEPYLLKALQEMVSNQWLNNTILILLSDRGMRFGPLRQKTRQGLLEERLPFLYVVLPEKFKTRFPTSHRNMQINSHKLATTFDVHATMKDLLNPQPMEESAGRLDSQFEIGAEAGKGKERGVSLFRQISDERTCDMIGIPIVYCACATWTNVSAVNDPFIQKLGEVAVQTINKKLTMHKNCDQLTLVNVTSAALLNLGSGSRTESNNNGDKLNMWAYYVSGKKVGGIIYEITFETSPGDGEFYAGMFQNSESSSGDGIKVIDNVERDITRISRYGTDADCMQIKEIKQFCHCNQNATKSTN